MRYDTFTIHAVGDYTSVESQETQKNAKTRYSLCPYAYDPCASP